MRAAARWGTAGLSITVATALALGGTDVATAQSRAAHRWNHTGAAAARTAAADSTPGTASAQSSTQVIRLNEVFTDAFVFVDVGKKGDSPGDYGVFRDPVADPNSGRPVGTIDVQCIAAYADQCRGSIDLRDRGQIVFDGITPLGVDPDEFAVTGGTGEFQGVGGRLVVSFPSDSFARLTVRLAR